MKALWVLMSHRSIPVCFQPGVEQLEEAVLERKDYHIDSLLQRVLANSEFNFGSCCNVMYEPDLP